MPDNNNQLLTILEKWNATPIKTIKQNLRFLLQKSNKKPKDLIEFLLPIPEQTTRSILNIHNVSGFDITIALKVCQWLNCDITELMQDNTEI
jgi:hypothetical protein